jgi:hypothetical protein
MEDELPWLRLCCLSGFVRLRPEDPPVSLREAGDTTLPRCVAGRATKWLDNLAQAFRPGFENPPNRALKGRPTEFASLSNISFINMMIACLSNDSVALSGRVFRRSIPRPRRPGLSCLATSRRSPSPIWVGFLKSLQVESALSKYLDQGCRDRSTG